MCGYPRCPPGGTRFRRHCASRATTQPGPDGCYPRAMTHSPTVPAAAKSEFLGHPRALAFLFATEMWERFSYYGMRALLVLYMVDYLLKPARIDGVIGLAALRRALAIPFGPLDIQPLASLIYGSYTGLVYLTPIFGGLLADRVLGPPPPVVIGALMMAAGHFMMAFEPLLLFALLALILGNGAFKPNMSAQVGDLYPAGDARRDRAYSIFYVGINLGALLAPLVCGTLGEKAGWHFGFAAAGVGMLFGLAIYLYASPSLPPDRITPPPPPPPPRPPSARRSAETSAARSARSSCCSCRRPCSGRPTSSRATRSRYGRTPIRTPRSISPSPLARFPPPGSRRLIRS